MLDPASAIQLSYPSVYLDIVIERTKVVVVVVVVVVVEKVSYNEYLQYQLIDHPLTSEAATTPSAVNISEMPSRRTRSSDVAPGRRPDFTIPFSRNEKACRKSRALAFTLLA